MAPGALGSGAARRAAGADDRREAAYHLIAVTLPVVGVVIAIVLLWHKAVSARDLAILLVGYLATGCGITVGYHRLLTHRAFKTGPRLRFLFAYLGALAFEGPPIRWVADHRKHHAFADADGDPHSPHIQDGEGWRGALRGLWHAHVGWLFRRSAGADPLRYASDLMSEPGMRWLSRNYGLVVLSGLLLPALAGFALGHTLAAAATGALWGGLVRMFLVHHMTWSVNSLGHYVGKRRFATDDESRNLGLIALPSLGDAYHHNHHAFPTSARHGLTAREVDLSWQLVRLLRGLGLAWDCVEFAPERIAAKEVRASAPAAEPAAAAAGSARSAARERLVERGYPLLFGLFLLAAIASLLGTYWDDSWHTNNGRDHFWIPPHIMIYVPISLAGSALVGWALLEGYRRGFSVVLRDTAIRLALIAPGVTLAAGAVDSSWHKAFGRDAVTWAPPHALGIFGVLALFVAMLALLARRRDRWVPFAQAMSSGGVVTAATILVIEYEMDVPQFNERYYLPALCLVTTIAFWLVRVTVARRWAATVAAVAHLGLIALVALWLTILNDDPPIMPLLVVPALLFDLGAERRWPVWLRVLPYVAIVYLLYVPYVDHVYHGTYVTLGQAASGLPLALALSWAALAALERQTRVAPAAGARVVRTLRGRAAAISALTLVSALALAPTASAHDPGEGTEIGTTHMVATVSGHRISLAGEITKPRPCTGIGARDMAVRRSHRTLRATLLKSGCAFRGSIVVPSRGRWFVYADLRRGTKPLESWLPVKIGYGPTRYEKSDRSLYRPAESPNTLGKTIATVLLYLVLVAFVIVVARFAARVRLEQLATGDGR